MAIDSGTTKAQTWERHGQSLLLALITSALVFTAKTLFDSNAMQATLVARIEALSNQVARLEGAVTSMQAQYVTRAEFSIHEQRIQGLEARPRPTERTTR